MPEPLTVLLIVDNAPTREDDIYVLPGAVHEAGGEEVWRGDAGRWIPLESSWRERRQEIKPAVRAILGDAPSFLPVVVRPLPDGTLDGVPLGWKLP